MQRSREGWVIDASVANKWYLRDEEFTEQADSFLTRFRDASIFAVAPHFSRHEVASALVVACAVGRLTWDKGARELDSYLGCGLSLENDPDWLLQDATRMTLDLHVSFYDAVYLVLAATLRMSLVTADRRLYEAVRQRLPFVHWLGDI